MDPRLRPLPQLIFMSRWLQLPLYLGLIIAQGVYVWQFWVELVHLVQATAGDSASAQAVIASVTPPGASPDFKMGRETVIMLLVLGLIDVVMISNPTAIIGISSIHLLRTFINAQAYDNKTLFYQTTIHIAFLLSAMSIAAVDRILPLPTHVRDMSGSGRH